MNPYIRTHWIGWFIKRLFLVEITYGRNVIGRRFFYTRCWIFERSIWSFCHEFQG